MSYRASYIMTYHTNSSFSTPPPPPSLHHHVSIQQQYTCLDPSLCQPIHVIHNLGVQREDVYHRHALLFIFTRGLPRVREIDQPCDTYYMYICTLLYIYRELLVKSYSMTYTKVGVRVYWHAVEIYTYVVCVSFIICRPL